MVVNLIEAMVFRHAYTMVGINLTHFIQCLFTNAIFSFSFFSSATSVNLLALTYCNAALDDLFRLKIFVVGNDVSIAFQGAQSFLKKLKNPPVISVVLVSGLANPEFLIEVESEAYKVE